MFDKKLFGKGKDEKIIRDLDELLECLEEIIDEGEKNIDERRKILKIIKYIQSSKEKGKDLIDVIQDLGTHFGFYV